MIGAQTLLVMVQSILLLSALLGVVLGIDAVYSAALVLLPLLFTLKERKSGD